MALRSDLTLFIDIIGLIAGMYSVARIRCLPKKLISEHSSISIIIPARNEEKNLPRLLQSIRSQNCRPAEILVVDDDSRDATATVARQGGARVIESLSLPPGWVGKAWACYQGARQAAGDYLFFLDADTWIEPAGLEKIAAEAARLKGAVSLYPFHRVMRWHEELSAFFNFCAIASGGGKRLFGPALVMGREQYLSCGGHMRVRDKILENHYLSEVLARERVPFASFSGRGALSFRMYPAGLRELTGGWSKAFASGAAHAPLSGLLPVIIWLYGCADSVRRLCVAAAAGAAGETALAALIYAFFTAQIYWALRRIGSFRLLTALLFPAPLIFFISIFARSLYASAFRRDVVWKSRAVHPSESAK